MSHRYLAVAFALALVSSPALGQDVGRISGAVSDVGGRPLAGASVRIVDPPRHAIVGSDGAFHIDSVPAGRRRMVARASGYADDTTSVDVRAGVISRVTIRLAPPRVSRLGAVVIRGQASPGSVQPAPDMKGAMILAGVKTEVLTIAGADANVAEKVPRQIFAKVPGIFVYDMDGTGNQINVSTRGLDPHRSWELNVRQDGVLLNSDLYGYPASHYSPPIEAIERIELVRGTAALQYGSQFGGLIDYVTKTGDTTRAVSVESINTLGSFGLFSSYNAVGGRIGRVTYYGYAQGRQENAYRRVSRSEASAQYLSATLAISPALDLRAAVGRSAYTFRIPGPLTDSAFRADPRTNTRSRNWFSPDIIVPALTADWRPDSSTHVTARVSGVFGDRSSVQFVGFANVADVPLASTGQHAPRQVDIDNFNSKTAELRATRAYTLGSVPSVIAGGVAVTVNDLRRRQQGRGTSGADYDLALSSGTFGRDLHYRTRAVAAYVENAFRFTPRLSVIPGARMERGRTRMDGFLAYYDPSSTPRDILHDFPLFGVRAEYKPWSTSEFYGGWSQAYRPMILKDVLPENALEQTDPNLKDARGWTLEGGSRGVLMHRVAFDLSAFAMRYDNRFGGLLLSDAQGAPYLFKTNVGSTMTTGIEARLEAPLLVREAVTVSAFSATAWFHARYSAGSVASGGKNVSIVGNRVEAVPVWITRDGVTVRGARWSATALASYTGSTFADPLNTVAPSLNGAVGKVPAYTILDVNASWQFPHVRLHAGVSNLLNAQYFTKRPAFYPGPGVWPSDGRTVQASTTLTF